jgi:hypothetical protein
MCHYPAVFLQKYLHILRRFLRRFLRRILRGCIAVASPSHRRIASATHRIGTASHRRRIASAPHRIAARNAGDFIRITYASGAADSLYAD